VYAIDVPEFAEDMGLVTRRARQFDVNLFSARRLETDLFLPGLEGTFDLILFTEILEHITFNPVGFWKRVYDLLRVSGKIYLTTPNSLRTINLLSTIKRALLLQGVGIDVPSIFGNVTYGHHWKEYSAAELKRYFQLLSSDFQVHVGYYSYRSRSRVSSLKDVVRCVARQVGRLLPTLGDELEVVISLDTKTSFVARAPEYV
jgi:2-polyprenyl-6-hydroxyphenyl methylase/3-demethylubiquinone-9 3-methyltransferase